MSVIFVPVAICIFLRVCSESLNWTYVYTGCAVRDNARISNVRLLTIASMMHSLVPSLTVQ